MRVACRHRPGSISWQSLGDNVPMRRGIGRNWCPDDIGKPTVQQHIQDLLDRGNCPSRPKTVTPHFHERSKFLVLLSSRNGAIRSCHLGNPSCPS